MSKRIICPTAYPWDPRYAQRPYSLAIEKHGMLCISGLTAETFDSLRDTFVLENTSLIDQTRVIFEKIGVILESAGYSFQDVVYTVDYALEASLPEYSLSGNIRKEKFVGTMPVSVGVLIDGIPNSAALMVVSVIAMKGGRNKRVVFPEGTPTWNRYRSRTFWPGFFVGNDWFWLSGSTGRVYDDSSGKETYPEGLLSQAEAIWSGSLGQVMKDAGIDPSTVVRVSDYIHPAALDQYSTSHRIRKRSLNGTNVCSTEIVVRRLLHRPALLETDAICYLGDDREEIKISSRRGERHRTSSSIDAIRCGKFLFCSAQGPIDHQTGEVRGLHDFREQVGQTYRNLMQVLVAGGSNTGDVVRLLEFTDPQNAHNHEVLAQARSEMFGAEIPAVTTITSNQLLQAGAKVGIEAWAVLQ